MDFLLLLNLSLKVLHMNKNQTKKKLKKMKKNKFTINKTVNKKLSITKKKRSNKRMTKTTLNKTMEMKNTKTTTKVKRKSIMKVTIIIMNNQDLNLIMKKRKIFKLMNQSKCLKKSNTSLVTRVSMKKNFKLQKWSLQKVSLMKKDILDNLKKKNNPTKVMIIQIGITSFFMTNKKTLMTLRTTEHPENILSKNK